LDRERKIARRQIPLHILEDKALIPVPYQKLHFFREKINLDESYYKTIEPFKKVFVQEKDRFADYFYDFFLDIDETAMFLRHYEIPGSLKKSWAQWFENLFRADYDDEFIAYLWRIGIKHVEVNLDQRYANLGFSKARQFCEQIILSEIPPERRYAVSQGINKLMDLCILVETNAYIEARARCDMDIIMGVSDRVRNKITTIGGTIKRLQRKLDTKNPIHDIYNTLISDSTVCERMVADTSSFMEMSRREPQINEILLEELIRRSLERVQTKEQLKNVSIEIKLDPAAPFILADSADMEALFFHLLQNSLEAVNPDKASVHIFSTTDTSLPDRVQIEIFNTGIPIKMDEPERVFSPFFSTKPFGTGFGLAIARLAVRKNYGKLYLQPVPGKGTKVLVILPSATSAGVTM
jgi:signal transduction histidine kinase